MTGLVRQLKHCSVRPRRTGALIRCSWMLEACKGVCVRERMRVCESRRTHTHTHSWRALSLSAYFCLSASLSLGLSLSASMSVSVSLSLSTFACTSHKNKSTPQTHYRSHRSTFTRTLLFLLEKKLRCLHSPQTLCVPLSASRPSWESPALALQSQSRKKKKKTCLFAG